MATVVSRHVRHLGIFKNFILHRTTANFAEISRKHVLVASDRNKIDNRVYKKKLEQIFPKIYSLSISNFNLHNKLRIHKL